MPETANRFDFIRLALAAGVFVYHGTAIGAAQPFGPLEWSLSHIAELSIQGFFIVSGLLVAGSFERASSLLDYVGKRARRLYPAYAAIILVPAAISLAMTRDVQGVASYLGANLVFLNFLSPTLPGLFEGNRFPEVNGALWTLKIEVMFYIALPIILLVLRRFGAFWWVLIAAIYAAGEAWAYFVPQLAPGGYGPELGRQLPGQMAFFAMGIALWKASPGIQRRWAALALCGTALLGASFLYPFLEPLRAFALAGVIGAIAWAPGPKLNVARYGDVSYGLYITHFPILQALAAAGLATSLGLAAYLALATALTLAASFALWHLVEKPALRPSSHYRRVARES
ncbi:acyltransferase [Hyphomonas sp. CACIAM 19H1]|uniref:acyltransferase family protein n=1 Tax=Hyphomonas sp. CACIAM 19H1 TaxID=1873716 RepID=UPI000DEE1BEE|nr:acyltransferase [Hyphomonas sp. CACIAM 19H1]AXE64490.1 acyltransferase [Hyphomonas sp. CACIAM 19H1]